MHKKALILVDIQNDFLPGGALAIKDGEKILPMVDKLVTLPFQIIVASKDWHPPNHISFAANHKKNIGEKIIFNDIEQILWPDHCVQNTHGAEFADRPFVKKIFKTFFKGTEASIDSYSAFFDNGHIKSTGLDDYLKNLGIEEVYIAGLATDYCVKYTALDALNLGFKVFIITDACKGINPNEVEQALKHMEKLGAFLISLQNIANDIV
jgi:nicotinamidase/pyrazinamidase